MAQQGSAWYELRPLKGSRDETERERDYLDARARYFQEHQDLDVAAEIDRLFSALGIS